MRSYLSEQSTDCYAFPSEHEFRCVPQVLIRCVHFSKSFLISFWFTFHPCGVLFRFRIFGDFPDNFIIAFYLNYLLFGENTLDIFFLLNVLRFVL